MTPIYLHGREDYRWPEKDKKAKYRSVKDAGRRVIEVRGGPDGEMAFRTVWQTALGIKWSMWYLLDAPIRDAKTYNTITVEELKELRGRVVKKLSYLSFLTK